MRRVLDGDARFISCPPERLSPYRNFERALTLAPAEAQYVALCDQDDRWYPEKLAGLRAALGSAQLVYSDQRLVTADGRVLRDSLWHGRRHDRANLASMLVANTAPGRGDCSVASCWSGRCPFPSSPASRSMTIGWPSPPWRGELAYVDRALYDYVQHDAAVQGDVTGRARRPNPGVTWLAGGVLRRLRVARSRRRRSWPASRTAHPS